MSSAKWRATSLGARRGAQSSRPSIKMFRSLPVLTGGAGGGGKKTPSGACCMELHGVCMGSGEWGQKPEPLMLDAQVLLQLPLPQAVVEVMVGSAKAVSQGQLDCQDLPSMASAEPWEYVSYRPLVKLGDRHPNFVGRRCWSWRWTCRSGHKRQKEDHCRLVRELHKAALLVSGSVMSLKIGQLFTEYVLHLCWCRTCSGQGGVRRGGGGTR